jgi:hypothetical protein
MGAQDYGGEDIESCYIWDTYYSLASDVEHVSRVTLPHMASFLRLADELNDSSR